MSAHYPIPWMWVLSCKYVFHLSVFLFGFAYWLTGVLFQEPFMLWVCLLTLLIALFLFFCLVKVFDLMLPGLSFLFSFMASEFYFSFIYLPILATWHLVLRPGILVPWPGMEPVPHAVEARSLNHWTAREVLCFTLKSLLQSKKIKTKLPPMCLLVFL